MGLDISNQEISLAARNLTGYWPNSEDIRNAYAKFKKLGIDKKRVDDAIKDAQKRKGIILALSKNILDSHALLAGDKKEGDLKIPIPEGLNLNFLSGLEPMGEEEYDYFEKLQNKIQ